MTTSEYDGDLRRIPSGIKQVDHEWSSVKNKLAQRNDLPLTEVSQPCLPRAWMCLMCRGD